MELSELNLEALQNLQAFVTDMDVDNPATGTSGPIKHAVGTPQGEPNNAIEPDEDVDDSDPDDDGDETA